MFSSNAFDYVNTLGTALDATALRNEIISNNIANVDTPEYKRKDIRFEPELKQAFLRSDDSTVDATVKHLDLRELEPEVYTDYAELSYRYDGNKVDIDNENVILAKNQIKYNGLMASVNKEFSNLKRVMN